MQINTGILHGLEQSSLPRTTVVVKTVSCEYVDHLIYSVIFHNNVARVCVHVCICAVMHACSVRTCAWIVGRVGWWAGVSGWTWKMCIYMWLHVCMRYVYTLCVCLCVLATVCRGRELFLYSAVSSFDIFARREIYRKPPQLPFSLLLSPLIRFWSLCNKINTTSVSFQVIQHMHIQLSVIDGTGVEIWIA